MNLIPGPEIEPYTIWDARCPDWPLCKGQIDWAASHIPDHSRTFRVVFYRIDGPSAVAYRFSLNESSSRFWDPELRDLAQDPPAAFLLDELPPYRMYHDYHFYPHRADYTLWRGDINLPETRCF